jgi:hypothetical protein
VLETWSETDAALACIFDVEVTLIVFVAAKVTEPPLANCNADGVSGEVDPRGDIVKLIAG